MWIHSFGLFLDVLIRSLSLRVLFISLVQVLIKMFMLHCVAFSLVDALSLLFITTSL